MQKQAPNTSLDQRLNDRLARTGLRLTAQRREVYNVLLRKRDHPSAEEVFVRAKASRPDISMATVYNCLQTLVKCGLVRQVNHDRGATRYCSNLQRHHHFYCDGCGGAFDIDPDPQAAEPAWHLPSGFHLRHFEVSFRGLCSDCASRGRSAAKPRPKPGGPSSARPHSRRGLSPVRAARGSALRMALAACEQFAPLPCRKTPSPKLAT